MRSFDAGQYPFRQEDEVEVLHVVDAGSFHLVRHQADGGMAVLQRAAAGSILAEASIFSDRYHCGGVATAAAKTAVIPVTSVKERLRVDIDFSHQWALHLARELHASRKRAEIMSLKTVKARLEAWISWNAGFPSKGMWKQIAEEIGVSPEALYREIARRRS
ncbi:Putative transcriptional regulator, Crp/Fnr family [Neorhizobium galegae bv. orientalis]|nr:Putative transcriptional regulator, Crp/Fnr family [Neorhizobium galegae bv. orientalis]